MHYRALGQTGLNLSVLSYGASSLGIRLDVENAGARFLVVLFFYVFHQVIYIMVARGLVRLTLAWSWQHEVGSALANAFLGVFLFFLMDRFKQRA